MRRIHDDIDARVQQLLSELAPPTPDQKGRRPQAGSGWRLLVIGGNDAGMAAAEP